MPNVIEADYWADGELELPRACAVCSSIQLTALYVGLVDQEEGIPGVWGMLRCDRCGSLLLSPRPTREAIGKAYRSYYTHRSPDGENAAYNGTTLVWKLANGYLFKRFHDVLRAPSPFGAFVFRCLPPLRQQLDYLYRHLPAKPGRLLDVGCGNGAFLLRARNAGWCVQGVEPDHAAAAQAVDHGLAVFEGDLAGFKASDTYDVITLAHVIEHLHDPATVLRTCLGLLRPGGKIWIATPNVKSIGHRLFKTAWQPLETPRHIVMPAPFGLQALLMRAGFEDVSFVRRGRGSRKRLDACNQRAAALGVHLRWTPFWSAFIDLYASLSPFGAEELVVTARRPRLDK